MTIAITIAIGFCQSCRHRLYHYVSSLPLLPQHTTHLLYL